MKASVIVFAIIVVVFLSFSLGLVAGQTVGDSGFWKNSSRFWEAETHKQEALTERALVAGERCVTLLEKERAN